MPQAARLAGLARTQRPEVHLSPFKDLGEAAALQCDVLLAPGWGQSRDWMAFAQIHG